MPLSKIRKLKRGPIKIPISSFENFIVRIFVVGYKNEGEACVILFFDYERILLSMIVDCYKKDDLIMTAKILDKYGVKKIDLACWTHPHDDHSPGFDDVVGKYSDEKTIVYHPGFKFKNFDPEILRKECTSSKTVFENLKKLNQNYNGNLLHCIDVDPANDNSRRYLFVAGNVEKELEFCFLTPFKEFVCQYDYIKNEKKVINVNDFSISFIMSLDKYVFYFGGDAENQNAQKISDDDVFDMRWVKVPHHCSLGGKSIADRLDENMLDCAASTVYSPQLPKTTIQNIYKSKGRLFMTQKNAGDIFSDFGIIQFDYLFENDRIKIIPTLYNNATEYR